MAGRKETERRFSIAAVVAIVLIASVVVFIKTDPERVVAISEDRLLRVSGFVSGGASLEVKNLDSVEIKNGFKTLRVYELSLGNSAKLKNGEIIFKVPDTQDERVLYFYLFNRETLEWEPTTTEFDLLRSTISSPVFFSGSVIVAVATKSKL
jgi:hypothetical protein